MSDMLSTITPKSDQLNFEDFIGRDSMIIKITSVKVGGSAEQPVSVFYEGDNNKPVKFCKSMRRVLVHCWGNNSSDYVGRSIKLFGDPTVKWAGAQVGGIRISHLSHITEPMTLALSASKGNRKPYTVKPLVVDTPVVFDIETSKEVLRKCLTMEALVICFTELFKKTVKGSKEQSELVAVKDEMKSILEIKN